MGWIRNAAFNPSKIGEGLSDCPLLRRCTREIQGPCLAPCIYNGAHTLGTLNVAFLTHRVTLACPQVGAMRCVGCIVIIEFLGFKDSQL